MFAGQRGVKNSVSLLAMLSVVWFLVGWGSCASRVPVTISADSAVESEGPENVESAEPDAAGRLQNCMPGTADCDRDPSNDCEAVLADDTQNCGGCGVQCNAPHATSSCLAGTCRIRSCAPGHCDADKEPENGCETAAKTCAP